VTLFVAHYLPVWSSVSLCVSMSVSPYLSSSMCLCLSSSVCVCVCVQKLLNNPTYIGLKHKRVRGHRYDELIDEFLHAVTRRSLSLSVCVSVCPYVTLRLSLSLSV